MSDNLQNYVVMVPHTHWDREWYLPFEAFRMRLVKALDALCENMQTDTADSFHMDGQTIVLEDYEEIRGRSEKLRGLVKAGRIQVGPWYVLPDEFLPSGEALIRNIQLGMKISEQWGGASMVGYLPDMFGHTGQMPQILSGFGINSAVVWRGVPPNVARCGFTWKAQDGTEIFAAFLPMGYSNGFNLPPDPGQVRGRLTIIRAIMSKYIEGPTWLMMAGTDHQQPRKGMSGALGKALEGMDGWGGALSSLADYVGRLRNESKERPVATGELRNPHYAPILPATASTRMYLKKRDFALSSLMERYAEPLAEWNRSMGGADQRDFIDYAWKLLLQNHPHDSICGCSTDEVHNEMETRYEKIETVVRRVLNESVAAIGARMKLARGNWYGFWSPAGSNSPVPLIVELEGRAPKNAALKSPDGKIYPLQILDKTEPGMELGNATAPGFASPFVLSFLFQEEEMLGGYLVKADVKGDKNKATVEVGIGKAPAGMDLKRAADKVGKDLGKINPSLLKVKINKEPRTRAVAVVDMIKPFSLAAMSIVKDNSGSASSVKCGDNFIENSFYRITAGEGGALTIEDLVNGKTMKNALRFVDEADRGDEYTFEPAESGPVVDKPLKSNVKIIHRGPVAAAMRIESHYKVPAEYDFKKKARSKKEVPLKIVTDVTLYNNVRRMDFRSEFDNTARDHRLKVLFEAPFEADEFICESAFETVHRKANVNAVPRKLDPSDILSMLIGPEAAVGFGAHKGFAVLEKDSYTVAFFNRGLPEIEALKGLEGTALALTLVRSVGTISRDDLSLRLGHAGPAIPTPRGQCPGRQMCEYAFYSCNGSWQSANLPAAADMYRNPPLPFPVTPQGGELTDSDSPISIDNPSIIVTAMQASPDGSGASCIRMFNSADTPQKTNIEIHCGFSTFNESDFMGKPKNDVHIKRKEGRSATIEMPPFRIVTIRVEK